MEAQQQSPAPIKTSPYLSPMHQYAGSITTLTNPDNELYKMELTLRNLRLDKEKNLVAAGEPLVNDVGVTNILGIAQGLLNRVTILSNLSKKDVEVLMMFLVDTLTRDLMVSRISYGIKTFDARDKIIFTVVSMCYVTLKRGFEEGDKRFWKGSLQEIYAHSDTGKEKRSSLSALNPFKRR